MVSLGAGVIVIVTPGIIGVVVTGAVVVGRAVVATTPV